MRTRGALASGAAFGVAAGVIFVIMEIIGAAMMGNPALMPVRMFASTLLGRDALMGTSLGAAVLVGLLMHFALSAVYGVIYGAIESRMSFEARKNWGRQSVVGLLFGVGLWFLNFQIIARLIYPWFLDAPQFLQLMLHALFFGLPLGLMFAARERRRPTAVVPPGKTVHA